MATERHATRPSTFARTRCAAPLLALLQLVTACHTWSAPTGPSADALTRTSPVRATLTDGRVVELEHVHVAHDTVFGAVHGTRGEIAIPLADVHGVSVRRLDQGRTTMLVVGVVAVSAAIAYVIANAVGDAASAGLGGVYLPITTRVPPAPGGH